MGNEKMKNLEKDNIFQDFGSVPYSAIDGIESQFNVRLPQQYVQFIIKHNGADLNADVFDYYDPNIEQENSNGISFEKVETIQKSIELLKLDEDPDWGPEYLFEDGLIPFGDNGGGDLICFDYRKDKTTDNPPIVIWNHDMGFDHRVVFIANNFGEFVNMLHEPED